MKVLAFPLSEIIRVPIPGAAPGSPERVFGRMVLAEFRLEQGDEDMRCSCKVIELNGDGSAAMAWDRACPVHPALPGGGVALL